MIQAFFIYNLLMLLLFAIWYLGVSETGWTKPISSRRYFELALISIVLYTLVLGLRYNVGGDYQGYVDYYETTTEHVSSADVPFEIGFYWLIRTLKLFELPTTALFLFTCGIQITLMTVWLRRHSFMAPWFIYFYFTTLFAFESLNLIRQAMAFLLILCAMPHLVRHNRIKYFSLIGLASTIHVSALLFLPMYFLLNREWISSRRWQVFILLFSYASAEGIKEYLFNIIPLFSLFSASEGYGSIQQALYFEQDPSLSAGLIFILITDLIVIIASPWLKQSYAAWGFRAYYNAFFIGAVLTPVVFYANYITFVRLAFYFYSFRFIALSFLVAWLFARSSWGIYSKVLGTVLIVAYYAWFSVAIFRGAAWCAPFQFIFQ